MPVLVSTIAYHPRPRHTEQISSIQVCTCLTKARTRSVPFVPQHVGSTGAKWSAMVESSQCFLVAPRLDVKVYGNAHQVFEVQICTICVDQLQNGPPKSPQSQYNTIQYNTIQYNTIQYNTIQYNTIQYNTIQYNTIQYNTIQYNTIQYNTIQYNTIQYNTIQYNTIQYNTIQYNTIQYNTIQTIQYIQSYIYP